MLGKGKIEEKTCPACGAKLRGDVKFCTGCGAVQPIAPAPAPRPKMSRKKRIAIAGGVLLAVLAVAAAALFWYFYSQEKEYQANMELGLRYLSEGNYQEAVLAFDAAIEIKPRSAEAYVGRGDANTGLERFRNAEDDYRKALEQDGKSSDAYLGLANALLERGKLREAVQVLEEGFGQTGDERLSRWREELDRLNSGNSSLSGAVSEYLRDGGTALLPGARVRLYVTLDDMPRLARVETTDAQGGFTMEGLVAGTYILHVDAKDHIGIVTNQELEEGEESYTELFLMIPETRAVRTGETGSLDAYVTNALNGERIAGVEVVLRPGWNARTGDPVDTLTSDGSGRIVLDGLDYGYYTAQTSADGFMPAYHNVAVLPEDFDSEWNLPMSPVLGEGETRIVLTWNEYPWDLDSHLVSQDFHVFFGDQNGYDAMGRHRANLDWDDTDSYGPETVTIYQGVDGVYTYSVFDYTNGSGGYGNTSALSASGATVRVYQGSGLTAEYHVPTGMSGYTWTVFRIYPDGRIESVNTVGFGAP